MVVNSATDKHVCVHPECRNSLYVLYRSEMILSQVQRHKVAIRWGEENTLQDILVAL